MKKLLFVFVSCLLAATVFFSCASTGGSGDGRGSTSDGRAASGGKPQFVRNAERSVAGQDVIVGTGNAKMATLHLSREAAQARARADISRKMSSTVRASQRDYTAASEVDPSAIVQYFETFARILSDATLVGTVVIEDDMDTDGNYWVVMTLGKDRIVNEINQAAAAAKLAVPAMQAYNAEERMDEMFDRMRSME